VTRLRPELGITAEHLRPHLQRGFPWHTPDVVRAPCSADEWWEMFEGVFAILVRQRHAEAAVQCESLHEIAAIVGSPR
jgi:hypothetical protein